MKKNQKSEKSKTKKKSLLEEFHEELNKVKSNQFMDAKQQKLKIAFLEGVIHGLKLKDGQS